MAHRAAHHRPLLELPALRTVAAVILLAILPGPRAAALAAAAEADLVVTGGRIYTVDPRHDTVQAMAVKDSRIVFVGTDADARAWIGPHTQVEALSGRSVLPGLVDAHVHPLDIADLDVCDLDDKLMSLRELSGFVAACIQRFKTPPGAMLTVYQWNYSQGNQTDPQHPTLRAALDAASTQVRIQLMGEDGHHSAYNSLTLAQARNAAGKVVGLSRATLADDFARYREFIGVDAYGEPNGVVTEDARYFINPASVLYLALDQVLEVPERITQRLNSAGITAVLDAMAAPEGLPVYDKLDSAGKLTVRVTLAQFFDPSRIRRADGTIDYDSILRQATAIRARYAHNPLIRADVVKIFADGVLEGNPLAVPPTLPEGAQLQPFLQPIFAFDAAGNATVKGYVDTGSTLCRQVRAEPQRYQGADALAFDKTHGFYPIQCTISNGRLQHERSVILEYARRMHLAGFNLHIHAIGDRAVRTAVDAIEGARAADGNSSTRDALAHVQLAHPEDIARIGRDHLYIAYTYAWMDVEPQYDMTVIPFIEHVNGSSSADLHRRDSYYENAIYPVRATQKAGAILAAGSDAPVETRDPRPFVNMAVAVARRRAPEERQLSPWQAITLPEAIEAYTINGARMLNIAADAGSLEVGKSADFIVIDRDILALAAAGHPEQVGQTRVLQTWFRGVRVYSARGAVTPRHGKEPGRPQ